jgi:hypothetical protein
LITLCFVIQSAELSVESNGYLFIVASGGLNQQRTGVSTFSCDVL